MAISEIDLQNRSETNDYNNANRQLEKRMATVALSAPNDPHQPVAASD